MRCFVSVNLEDKPLINKVGEFQKELINNENGIRPVPLENVHYTLKFLGEIDDKTVHTVIAALEKISYKEFSVELRGVGAFPDTRMMRVIWIGAASRELIELAELVNSALAGIGKDEENFTPHLTIARIKYISNRERILNLMTGSKTFGSFKVNEFALMMSELKPDGPRYSKIRGFSLIHTA